MNAWRLHIDIEQDQILACGTVCTINIQFYLSTKSVKQFIFYYNLKFFYTIFCYIYKIKTII